jgi:glycosyltransferase involved in cell wall biosynthesis
VHELKTVIDEFRPDLTKIDRYISHYIVPSFLNKDTLVIHFNISPTKITVIRETTVLPECKIKKTENVKNVVMCGGAYWRKGDDIFIQVASEVIKKLSNTHFYWVGYFSKERYRVNTADIEKLNLSKNIHLIQETNTPEVWLYQSDLFLLTSREDPFPLAAMEAGLSGLPVICFEKATGISEVIDQKMVVPYLNVAKMAEKTIEILNNKDYAYVLGQQNKEVFSKLNPKNIALEIDNVIKKIKTNY